MHGGTNFGFMNGANILGFGGMEVPPVYVPDVTRYINICIMQGVLLNMTAERQLEGRLKPVLRIQLILMRISILDPHFKQ